MKTRKEARERSCETSKINVELFLDVSYWILDLGSWILDLRGIFFLILKQNRQEHVMLERWGTSVSLCACIDTYTTVCGTRWTRLSPWLGRVTCVLYQQYNNDPKIRYGQKSTPVARTTRIVYSSIYTLRTVLYSSTSWCVSYVNQRTHSEHRT